VALALTPDAPILECGGSPPLLRSQRNHPNKRVDFLSYRRAEHDFSKQNPTPVSRNGAKKYRSSEA
jgi:hypothetical protein